MARPGASPEVRQRAAERQRQVLQLRLRGLSFDAIGKQLGCSQQIAFKVYRKALRAIVHPAVDELRKLEAERIADLRQRIWSELAGRPDPVDSQKTIRPDPGTVVALIGQAIKLARHEAAIFGMVVQPDAPPVNVLNVVQIEPATAQRMAELYVARHTRTVIESKS
jgi:hypothetical protein